MDGTDSDEEDWTETLENVIPHQSTKECQSQLGQSLQTHSRADCVHKRIVIHIDIDCFYAQVEMIRNPELRGKPLGIQQKNIIVTSNYEARKHGVGKLMYLADALKACPQLCIVSGEDLTNYRDMSYKVTNLLSKYSETVERLGFDENFVDVSHMVKVPPWNTITDAPKGHVYGQDSDSLESGHMNCGCERNLTIGSHIAEEMRKCLLEELGITCCAGIAHNKLLSKLVAGTHKPNQQTLLYPGHITELMNSIQSLRKIPGIGHKTSERLQTLGVTSIIELQNCSVDVLKQEFGSEMAHTLKNLSKGVDDTPVVKSGQPQSLSDEDSFKKCDNMDDAKAKIPELLDSLLKRLQEDGRTPQTLRVSVRKLVPGVKYPNRLSRQAPIPSSVFSSFNKGSSTTQTKLLDLATKLFEKAVDITKPFHLTLINLCFANMSETTLSKAKSADIQGFFRSPKTKKEIPKEENIINSESNSPSSSKNVDILPSGNEKSPNVIRAMFAKVRSDQERSDNNDSNNLHKDINVESCLNHSQRSEVQKQLRNLNGESSCSSDSVLERNDQSVITALGDNTEEFDLSVSSMVSAKPEESLIEDLGGEKMSVHTAGDGLTYLKTHLGNDIDVDTFLELPADLQKELISQKYSKDTEAVKKLLVIIENHLSGKAIDPDSRSVNQQGSGHDCSDLPVDNKRRESSRVVNVNSCKDVPNSFRNMPGTSLFNNNSENECINNNHDHIDEKASCCKSVNEIECDEIPSVISEMPAISASSHSGSSSKELPQSVNISHGKQSLGNSHNDLCSSNTSSLLPPPHIDPTVFRELPIDIQKSLCSEWQTKNEFEAMKKRKLSISPQGQKSAKRKSGDGNIRSFFKKK